MPLTEENTSRFLKSGKRRLHYNEAGSGPALIMLHGSGPGATAWSNFKQNIEALSRTRRVILLDVPGWGRSEEMDPSQYPRHLANAEAVQQLMDELGIEKAALVGNSMGGLSALTFAGMAPERVTHCITMGMGPLPGASLVFAPFGLSEGLRILFETYRDPSPKNFKRMISIMVYDQAFATDELAQQRSDMAKANLQHLTNFLKALPRTPQPTASEWEELPKRLAQTRIPMMLMHGRDDRVISYEVSLQAAALIPTAKLVVVNRCGHWMQVEHTETFNALVEGFLSTRGSAV